MVRKINAAMVSVDVTYRDGTVGAVLVEHLPDGGIRLTSGTSEPFVLGAVEWKAMMELCARGEPVG